MTSASGSDGRSTASRDVAGTFGLALLLACIMFGIMLGGQTVVEKIRERELTPEISAQIIRETQEQTRLFARPAPPVKQAEPQE